MSELETSPAGAADPRIKREPFEMGNLHILKRIGANRSKVHNQATFATTWLAERDPDYLGMAPDDPRRPQNLHVLKKKTGPGASMGRTVLLHAERHGLIQAPPPLERVEGATAAAIEAAKSPEPAPAPVALPPAAPEPSAAEPNAEPAASEDPSSDQE